MMLVRIFRVKHCDSWKQHWFSEKQCKLDPRSEITNKNVVELVVLQLLIILFFAWKTICLPIFSLFENFSIITNNRKIQNMQIIASLHFRKQHEEVGRKKTQIFFFFALCFISKICIIIIYVTKPQIVLQMGNISRAIFTPYNKDSIRLLEVPFRLASI